MRDLFIDTETFCEVPIERGHHRYAEEAEVTLVPYAWDDEEPECIDCTLDDNRNWRDVVQDLLNRATRIYLHNAAFDITVLAKQGVVVPIWKVVDTMVQAMAHSLPGSLDKLSEIFKLGDQGKVKDGKRLINLFAKPRPKNQKLRRATRETHPEDWALFIDYAIYDVVAMRALVKRKFLPTWNIFKPNSNQDTERTLWELDQKINNRGFAVDTELATAALRAAGTATYRLAGEVQELTNGAIQSTTQRGRTLEYLQAMGVDLDDLKGGTVDTLLRADDADPGILDPEARAILENRSQAAATSPAKYRALLGAVSTEDARLRGALQFCGALRTARWGGRIFQPQNLPRPKLKQHRIDSGIAAMKAGVEDLMFDDVMNLCTSAIRGCIVAPEGKKLVIADLANIEGRMLAWLAGEEWKLQAFRDYDTYILDEFGQKIPEKGDFKRKGPDLYIVGAAGILGKPISAVTKDDRQVMGKVPELACGYQGSVGAFTTMGALYGVKLPEEEVLEIVRAWRTKNSRIKALWYDVERAAVRAVRNPGETFTAGKLKFRQDGSWLRMLLPSGRYLCYPHAKVGDDCEDCAGSGLCWSDAVMDAMGDEIFVRGPCEEIEGPKDAECASCDGTGMVERDKLTYMGVDQYTRKWKRLRTYGGKLVENATQAASRDVLAHGMLEAEQAGYEVVLSVHDELLCETPDDDRFTVAGLAKIMSTNPEWAEGLPLAAAGFETHRYRKD